MRKACMHTLYELAEKDKDVILMTGDVVQDMDEFQQKIPERFYNIGLCECSMIAMSGGMASMGFKPVVYSITPFLLERGFEFIKMDVDTNNLSVIFIGYSDYPHHGISHTCLDQRETVSVFKNIRAYFPENATQAIYSMKSAYKRKSPSFIFLKKSNGQK